MASTRPKHVSGQQQVIVIDSSQYSSSSDDDSIPPPSPFSPSGASHWNKQQQSMTASKNNQNRTYAAPVNMAVPVSRQQQQDMTTTSLKKKEALVCNETLAVPQEDDFGTNGNHEQKPTVSSSIDDSDGKEPASKKPRIEVFSEQPASNMNGTASAKKKEHIPQETVGALEILSSSQEASIRPETKKKEEPPKETIMHPPPPTQKRSSPRTTANLASKEAKKKRPSTRAASSSTRLAAQDQQESTKNDKDVDPGTEVIQKYIKLSPLPQKLVPLQRLTPEQLENLETALELDASDPEEYWKTDWSGNLGFFHRKVANPTLKRKTGCAKLFFWEWALASSVEGPCKLLLQQFLMHIYHLRGTPLQARCILADAYRNKSDNVMEMKNAVDRISYDPLVLQQDGWTTTKSPTPEGFASGGPHHIGSHLLWQKYEAVVIAYVHDNDLGDLWKAMWLEDNETFDLEADELQEALRKFQRKTSSGLTTTSSNKSSRFAATSSYTVQDIEHGIVLASTFHPAARQGVLWPARVMHVSEINAETRTKRSSSRNRIHVVFLAPYWNYQQLSSSGGRHESYGDHPSQAKNLYSSGPLFEVDTAEVSEATIQKYPYGGGQEKPELDIDQLRTAFRFTGLPQVAFSRFLDSHRLAMALKAYAQKELKATTTPANTTHAMATLTDTHVMSIRTAIFPHAVLHLPFEYVLSQLPPPAGEQSPTTDDRGERIVEPVLQLDSMLDAMKPPKCWGTLAQTNTAASRAAVSSPSTVRTSRISTPVPSPAIHSPIPAASISGDNSHMDESATWPLNNFVSDYLLKKLAEEACDSALGSLGDQLPQLLSRLRRDLSTCTELGATRRREMLHSFLNACLMAKSHGEDIILCSDPLATDRPKILNEWRRACERIYKHATMTFTTTGFGNGVTLIITDSRCNEHLTAGGCVERTVRLPAALKGAKLAGAGSNPSIQIVSPVKDRYTYIAEKKVLPKVHKVSYLTRMKARCEGLPPDKRGVPLTDDSDGQGGEDTMGSRGSYAAAVAGVAAALQAVDQIVGGQCVNAFCATRPPGHHAGRDLHPMKAVSNGFCLLNPAASAALYATTPQSEGGPGLKRVCVIDFDVHHGNGTQDVLCSTYDPRFLYVSIHAGGAHINGYDEELQDDSIFTPGSHSSATRNGIFPGRCGDSSPHEGVLNIPLGARVTAQDVGTVLVTTVSPRVEAFAPDLVILSAGFDAHKNDPLGMGGLSADDFGSITDVACSMAFRSCSGRVLSILEGGYGVPCCRPQTSLFLPRPPPATASSQGSDELYSPPSSQETFSVMPPPAVQQQQAPPQQQLRLLNLELPENMEDQLPAGLRRKVDRCHTEGFVECVCEHIRSLAKFNTRNT